MREFLVLLSNNVQCRGTRTQKAGQTFRFASFFSPLPVTTQAPTLALILKAIMQELKNIIDCYDKIAKNYADKFLNELNHKHLDRVLLRTFASENHNKGRLIDLGCGPGQTTKYLCDCGMTDILGVDISSQMVTCAQTINPHIHFETADILDLKYPSNFFGSAIAFYSIVHFDYTQIKIAFKQIQRILKENGQFLLTFHIGESLVHLDSFLDHQVNIDFY